MLTNYSDFFLNLPFGVIPSPCVTGVFMAPKPKQSIHYAHPRKHIVAKGHYNQESF